jgi:hypothetical protein
MSDEKSLTITQGHAIMPVMDVGQAVGRYRQLAQFVGSEVMRENVDFGKIPGTSGKPVLLKPGAEKLTTFFGLRVEYEVIEKEQDWTGEAHGGEPFFYYWYRCRLFRGDTLVAEADGSCNSRESKYRYRKEERVCPACGEAAIIKGKAEYGGGWLCWKKRGGCGAKFPDGDASIEGQEVGRVLNPDVADIVNTLQKMAQKRALIAATLIAVNASDFFTQDIEDFTPEFVEGEVVPPEPQPEATRGNGKKWRETWSARILELVSQIQERGEEPNILIDAELHEWLETATRTQMEAAGRKLKAQFTALEAAEETPDADIAAEDLLGGAA